MITERGPHGTVAVVTVDSDKEVVPHALSVLRNHSCRHCLPVYMRDLFGQKQLCVDITGLIRITEPAASLVNSASETRRKAIVDLLGGISDMLDVLLDPSGLRLRPDDIWLDPERGSLFFVCLPLRSPGNESVCALSDVDAAELESVLMHPFFSGVVSESSRHQLTDCILKGDEIGFRSALDALNDSDPIGKIKSRRFPDRRGALSIILIMMLSVIAGSYWLSSETDWFLRPWEWGFFFTVIFSLLTIGVCMRSRGVHKESEDARTIGKPSASNRDLLFPEPGKSDSLDVMRGHCVREPGFLVEQSDYGQTLNKKRRCVIWTDDLLIGSDHVLCDFCIDHPSISARHARIVRRQGMFFLLDLGSREGSYIGHRKLFSHEENPILSGDSIRLGAIRFSFTHDERTTGDRSGKVYSDAGSP